jgi:hypothetical protein
MTTEDASGPVSPVPDEEATEVLEPTDSADTTDTVPEATEPELEDPATLEPWPETEVEAEPPAE